MMVLVALSAYQLNKMKMGSWLSKDLGNLRQIGLAVSMYATDHNGLLPTQYEKLNGGKWAPPYWSDQIRGYVGLSFWGDNPRLVDLINRATVFKSPSWDNNHYISGYGCNTFVISDSPSSQPEAVSVFRIPRPSGTIMACTAACPSDLQQGKFNAQWFFRANSFLADPLSTSSADPMPRPAKHGKIAALFVDGHCGPLDLNTVASDRTVAESYVGSGKF